MTARRSAPSNANGITDRFQPQTDLCYNNTCGVEVRARTGGLDISNTLTRNLRSLSGSVIKQSIRRRIVAIAAGLIVLMMATSVLSMVMVGRVGNLLDELTARYNPANEHLIRIDTLSLE